MTRIIRLKHCASTAIFFALIVFLAASAQAGTLKATVYMATNSGQGDEAGTVTFMDEGDGITITTDLKGLPAGQRGFHVHEKGDCSPMAKDGKTTPAGGAGGHYDPDKTGKHLGPEGGGHKGDLPVLTVADDGTAKVKLHVKGIKAEEFKDRAVMIHQGGDNYSDTPEALGGGGARIACGVIK